MEKFFLILQDPDGVMKKIVAERDPLRRIAMARQFVGTNVVPGSFYAMLAYPDRVLPVGSVTMEELQGVDALQNSFFEAGHVMEHPSEVRCGSGRGVLAFDQARRAFESGKRGKSVVDCYCSVRHNVMSTVDEFMEDRTVFAPRRELESAFAVLNQGGRDFVVVSSGLNHIPETLRILDNQGDVNYYVVSPKALEGHFPKSLTRSSSC